MTDSDLATEGPPSSEDQQDASERRKRLAAIVLLAVLLLLLILWILAHLATVPNTIGMTERHAGDVIREAGFSVLPTTVPAPERQVGRVMIQAPLGGTRYFTWWPVRVTIGTSVGYTLAGEPETSTEETGGVPILALGSSTEVMPYDPDEMAPLYFPPGYNELLMPNVQNMGWSKALEKLRRIGLTVMLSEGPSTTDVGSGRVYYQNPSPGVSIKSGQTVSVWVSQGPFNILSGPYKGYPFTPMELYPSPEVVP